MKRLEPKKGNLLLYMGLLVFAIAGLIYAGHLSRKQEAVEVPKTDERTIVVGMQLSPMGVCTAGDTLSGFYYDMMNQIGRLHNIKFDIRGYNQISNALERLDRGEYDVVAGDIPVTSTLREKYLFTDPIYADREVLVQLRDSVTGAIPYRTQNDLRGATLFLPSQSPYLPRVRNLSHEIGDTIYVKEEPLYGPEQLIIKTAMGEIPNVVVNEMTARQMLEDYPNLDASLTISFNQFQAWAVASENTILLDSLNTYIADFKSTPAYPHLLNQYFLTE